MNATSFNTPVNDLASFKVTEKELTDARALQKKVVGLAINEAESTDTTTKSEITAHSTTEMFF